MSTSDKNRTFPAECGQWLSDDQLRTIRDLARAELDSTEPGAVTRAGLTMAVCADLFNLRHYVEQQQKVRTS